MSELPPSYAAWPAGGGALGALIRTHDWAATPLGPVENWPPALRTVVDLVVHSPLPMTVLWGPDQVQVYNDSYATLCGPRHPHALGRPQRATWPELQDFVGPVHQAVLQGETRSYIRQRLVLERSGAPEEAWFDLSYSPVHHEGRVRGLVVTVIDVTADVHTTEALLLNEERFHTYAGTGIVYRMNADWSELRQLQGQGALAATAAASSTWLQDYIHPDDRPGLEKAIAQAIRTRGACSAPAPRST